MQRLAISCTVGAGLVLAGGGLARAESPLAGLEKALPPGWTMLETDSELVIRHDRPCFRVAEHAANESPGAKAPAAAPATPPMKKDGARVDLELRYRLEARWTPAQVADARHANAAVAAEVKAARDKYRIDAIKVAKGAFLPANADEKARLAEFHRAEAAAETRRVREPLCSVGDLSIFDGDETYAQLGLRIDPPEAAREAHAIVDLVKQTCGASR